MAVLNEISRPQRVEREPVDLAAGGLITVILGEGGDLPTDYGLHPRVRPVDGRIINIKDPQQNIPANTRGVVFGGGKKLDRKIFEAVHEFLKQRRIVYRIVNNDEHLLQALREWVPEAKRTEPEKPKTPEAAAEVEKKKIAERGSVKAFIEKHTPALLKEDAIMPIAEIGRRLFRLAQDSGIETTLGSLQQGVRVYKRDHRIGERPVSLQSEEQKGLTGIDEVIGHFENALAALKRMRDGFIKREAEHAQLSKQNAKMREVFTVFRDEVEGV